jgi:hypothetical protein
LFIWTTTYHIAFSYLLHQTSIITYLIARLAGSLCVLRDLSIAHPLSTTTRLGASRPVSPLAQLTVLWFIPADFLVFFGLLFVTMFSLLHCPVALPAIANGFNGGAPTSKAHTITAGTAIAPVFPWTELAICTIRARDVAIASGYLAVEA